VAAVKIGSRDGRGEEEEKKSGVVGGGGCFGWRWILGLGFPFFFVFFFQNCPPCFELWTHIYR